MQALLSSSAAIGLVVLAPPASHYSYYDSSRERIFEFTARFHAAAERAGEQLVAVADTGQSRSARDVPFREMLRLGVPGEDLLDFGLDDIWMRDFFVFQLSNTTVVRFSYAPAYLDATNVGYIDSTARALVREIWDHTATEVRQLSLVLDGGGLVWEPATRWAVLTERVLRDNPWLVGATSLSAGGVSPGPAALCCPADPYAGAPALTDAQLSAGAAALSTLLSEVLDGTNVTVAIVPEEPGAPRLGHVDGIANWLAPRTLALSRFSDAATYARYEARLASAFGAELTIVPFPHAPSAAVWEDGFESAEGIYVNFARTEHAVYVPVFGLPTDANALETAEAHADRPVVAVNASAVAVMGGSVRCLSSQLSGAPAQALVARAGRALPPFPPAPPPPTSAAAAAPLRGRGLAGATSLAVGAGVVLLRWHR